MFTTNGGAATMSLIMHFIPLFSQLLITMLAGSATNRRYGWRPLVNLLGRIHEESDCTCGRKRELNAKMAGVNGPALTL